MQTRQPGIDLVRCVGLLLVVGLHSFLNNGFYSEPQSGPLMWAANGGYWLCYCCNGIFLMLTGYLKSTKPFEKGYYRSLIPVLAGYAMTCVISFPIRHFLLGEERSLLEWIEKFLIFDNYAWYVEMYIGLLLFSPVLNMVMERLETKAHWFWLVSVMVFLSAAYSITGLDLIPDHWRPLYPFTYYVLGAAIRRWQPRVKPALGLAMAMLTAMGVGLATLLTTDQTVTKGFGQGYGGFWVTSIAVWLFLALYRLEPGPKTAKALTWMAGGCFEGYILSRLLDVWLYDTLGGWHSPEYYPLLFLCVTVPIYFISVVSGKLTHDMAIWCLGKAMKRP